MVKVPLPPAVDALVIRRDDLHVLGTDQVVWRLHRTDGPHVLPWNRLRHWGPVRTMRFDPHELPARLQTTGVLYATTDVPTAIAEVYQSNRMVGLADGSPYLTAWRPVRPLALLDLAGDWPIRAGASYALNTARRAFCRAWARAIHAARPDIDGLWSHSAMTGQPVVTLFTAAAGSFPERPEFSAPLDHPDLRARLVVTARRFGYNVG